jgi:hypothetical protein
VNAQSELARLLREQTEGAETRRADALLQLAATIESLPKNDRTVRVLRALRPYEQQEFPNPALQALISRYGFLDERDPQAFLEAVIEAIHPGMGLPARKPDRPWWASFAFSPWVWLIWTIRRRKKTCPECAERIKRRALVCRFCGHRFDSDEAPSNADTGGKPA